MSDMTRRVAELSAEKRQLLLQQLQKKREEVSPTHMRPHKRETSVFPLSFAQQRLWFLDQLEPGGIAYLVPSAPRLHGVLDPVALECSLVELIRRHEILRTTFQVREEQPVQVIHPAGRFRLPVLDLRGLEQEGREAEARRLAGQEAQQPCDLAQGPLLRTWLLRLDAQEHVLLVTMHHIISDAWSHGVFMRELTSLYRALVSGQPSPLAPLPIQYADFAVWQRQWLQGEVLQAQLDYWKRQLAGAPLLELPTDHPRPPIQTYRGAHQSLVLPVSLREELDILSQQASVTLFMLLLATFQVLLARYTGQTDISVGSPIANRRRAELGRLIGFFVNTLVLRTDLSGNPPFLEVLARVRGVALGAFAHQDVPFEQLVEVLQPERDLSRSPLFQVMFSLEQVSGVTEEPKGPSLSNLGIEQTTTKFDLTLSVMEGARSLGCDVEYNTDLFEVSTIRQLLRHWQALLEGIAAHAEHCVADLPLLTSMERQLILRDWNDTKENFPADLCIHSLFETQVLHTPDVTAIVYEDQQLTYTALNQRANQLAHYLQDLGVKPEILVGVCMERSLELIFAVLGILKAGGAYVPLDPSYPAERLEFMLEDAHVSVLLIQQHIVETLPGHHAQVVCLDTDWGTINAQSDINAASRVRAGNLAYVIYTSGSTGRPRGVLVPHHAVMNHCTAVANYYEVLSQDRVLQFASLSFDVAAEEIFPTILRGATLVLCSKDVLASFGDFFQFVEQEKLTILNLPAAYWHTWVSERSTSQATFLASVRLLIVGSEKVLLERFAAWRRSVDDRVRWCNAYGPTEATITTTIYEPESAELEALSVPIGRPIANVWVYVLDRYQQPVPIGVCGELYIGGVGVARGYLNRLELTAEQFLPDPFSDVPGARVYRTGDIVRYLRNGDLEFVGRSDEQVKIRGYRVEPGEVEEVLLKHPAVRETVVLAREDVAGGKRLVAYIVSTEPEVVPSVSELRRYLQEKLPDYMVPAFFMPLDALPLTPNGKVDRRVLPSPEASGTELSAVGDVARTPIEEMVAGIWCEVLRRSQAGIHDNFFELGGHSLLATQLIARVRAVLQVEIPLRSLFEAPTIAGLAQRVEQTLRGGQGRELPPLVPVARTQGLPLSFAQQRLWFFDQLEPESTAYLILSSQRLHGPLDTVVLEQSLQVLLQRHESLRTIFQVQEGQPIQVILPAGVFRLPLLDLRGLTREGREREARRLARQEGQCPCDLAKGPLLRVSLLRLETEEHVLLLMMHHIISDGWSHEVLVRELTTLYRAFTTGAPSLLPPLPIQYADFALWQRQWLQGEVLQAQLTYWKRQLAGIPPLDLPTDHPRPLVQTYRGTSQVARLPVALSQGLTALSQREGVTLFMLLLAAFQVLLAHYTGQHDISVGTPIANRTRTELEALIGFFVNTLVLRTNLSGNPPFVQVLRQVREVALGAYSHQDVPFEQVVEVLQPERNLSRPPLFQVMFSLQQAVRVTEDLGSGGLTSSGMGTEQTTTKFELSMLLTETAQGLHCGVEYNTDLFEASTISKLLEHWQTLLEGIVITPQTPVAQLPWLSKAERHRLLVEWNATQTPMPGEQCLHSLVETQVRRSPDAIALVCEERCLSYAALEQYANQLARYLQGMGLRAHSPVALCLERCLEGGVALLGVLKAGGVYVPMDPAAPSQRLAWLLEESQTSILITGQALCERLPPTSAQVLCLEGAWPHLGRQGEPVRRHESRAQDLAYVIYTSGSSGRPKGVTVAHQAIVNRLWWGIADVDLQAQDRVVQLASWSFDISLWELFGPWMVGATVVVVPKAQVQASGELLQRIQEEQITLMHVVPSLLNALVQEPGLAFCQSVRCVLCGGEAVSAELLRALWAVLPVPLHQYYGPTEAAISVSSWTGSPGQAVEEICIGRPIANSQLYLLDQAWQLVAAGMRGEVWIGGLAVASGYWQRPEQTAERFVPHPFSEMAGARVYRTGDVARYRPTGELEFVGRSDEQIKLRGYRIEPGEIEALLGEHAGVRESVVLAQEAAGGDKRLVAYVVGNQAEEAPSGEQLRRYLQEKLPDYMVPAYFVRLEALPLTSNGKVDRRALPRLERSGSEEGDEPVVPRTAIEEVIAGIWCEVLGYSQVSIHDNFFELGGHSLLATQLISRARAVLHVEVPLRSLFEGPTIAALAQRVEHALRAGQGIKIPPLVPVGRAQDLPLSFAQQRLWFLDQLEPQSTAYLIPSAQRLHGVLDTVALERGLEELVRRHESLRTTFQVRRDQPIQVIRPAGRFCLPLLDLSGLVQEERKAEARRLSEQEGQLPCDLAHGPLLRVSLLRLDTQEHVLLLTMHHIITDGWSDGVFLRELTTLYRAFVVGQLSPLPPLPIQYADFAVWQRQWLQGEVLQAQLAYWRRQLGDAPALELPADHPRPSVQSHRGAVHHFILSTDLSAALVALSRQQGATLFMTLLAAFQVLFYRYTGQVDIVVGTDIANRQRVETEGIIGFFVNLLALRTDLSRKPSFVEALYRVREMVLGAYLHQDTPFDLLVEKLLPAHTLDRMPLVHVLFVLQNMYPSHRKIVEAALPAEREKVGVPALSPIMDEVRSAKFDLALFIQESAGRLHGALNYSLDLFEASTIATMMARFEVLLQSIVRQPDTLIDVLEFFTEAEQMQQKREESEIRHALRFRLGERFDLPGGDFV